MKNGRPRASPRFAAMAVLIVVTGGVAVAENITPGNDGSKSAWSENLGWINLQPSGAGGPGVQVAASGLTGWAWSENAGWISLSCTNRSCASGSYGVTNDGCGILAGSAWSENAGWINFHPPFTGTGLGVYIDPVTGIFSGRAWSENAGWITFSSAGPNPYRIVTSWRAQVPAAVTGVHVDKLSATSARISWAASPGTTAYDVVQGRLSALRSSHGNYSFATLACIDSYDPGTSTTTFGNPSVGDGSWYLVRGANCEIVKGTYDSGSPKQVGSRDALIALSGVDCP